MNQERSRVWFALGVLFAINTLNFYDRQILGAVGETIRNEWRAMHVVRVRMALGAQDQHVVRMILGQGLKLVLVGVGLGVTAAFVVTRIIFNLLFGVTPTDPTIFFAVPLLLITVAMIASYLPARRALKVDPIVALREL